MKKYIYDIESYPNIFTFSYVSDDNSEKRTFEISFRKNEVVELFSFLDECHNKRCFLIGFNNVGFDYPVIHKLIKMRNNIPKNGVTIAKKMYQYTQEQIESFNGDFPNTVKESERYIQQIGLRTFLFVGMMLHSQAMMGVSTHTHGWMQLMKFGFWRG